MAAHPCCTEGTWKRECSPACRLAKPIHAVPSITPSLREGIGRWAEIARQRASRQDRTKERPERHAARSGELADDPAHRVRDAQQDRKRRSHRRQHDGRVSKVPNKNFARYELETGKIQRRSRAGSQPSSLSQPVLRAVRVLAGPRWPKTALDGLGRPINPRKHSRQQIEAIARTIEAFGFNAPILVDSEKRVVAGHARLEAARLLALQEVPVIRLDHLTEAQAKAYMLADNKLTDRSSWDDRKVAIVLKELSDIALDFEIDATGFEPPEIDLRIQSLEPPENSLTPRTSLRPQKTRSARR